MPNKKEKTSLIKINSDLYNKVKEKVNANSIEYPSIKHFVENAITLALGFKKYDIEGIPQDISSYNKIPLKDIMYHSNKNLTVCVLCLRFFLADIDIVGSSRRAMGKADLQV